MVVPKKGSLTDHDAMTSPQMEQQWQGGRMRLKVSRKLSILKTAKTKDGAMA